MESSANPTEENSKLVRTSDRILTAIHSKITVPSTDVGTYYFQNPSVTPDATESSVSIADLENLYWTEPLIHKAINIRANRLIGEGFELVPNDAPDVNPQMAKIAMEDCEKFLNKINYITFFRNSIINSYVSGNEWTELIYNPLSSLISLSHGDFRTIDFRRNFVTNKILVDNKGEPIGFWQYIENLAELHLTLSAHFGNIESYDNMRSAKERLNETTGELLITDERGYPIAALYKKPNYMFINKNELVHLSFNNLNDNFYGVSMIIPAYNSLIHLKKVMFAMAEAIDSMGYPKPVVEVGNEKQAPTENLMDLAQSLIQDPVRKEGYALPHFMKISYLQPQNITGDITHYPDWFVTAVSVGVRVPKEVLTGEGDANRASASVQSSDFEKDIEADRSVFEEYVYRILSYYLNSKGYLTTDKDVNSMNPYTPKIKWKKLITQDEVLREKMVLDKFNAGLITVNEARKSLGLNEIEDPSRADKFSDEIKKTEQNQSQISLTGSQFTAQHRLQPKAEINENLNKRYETEDVDYKKIAQDHVGQEITSVSDNDAKKIRDAIVNGESQGKSAKAIFEDVKKIGNYEDWQVRRILLTEHQNLVMRAEFEDATEKGMRYKKWDSTLDGDTSNLCKALHGQIVPINNDFKVTYTDESGKTASWKGQVPPSHPNCRSVIKYGIKKGVLG